MLISILVAASSAAPLIPTGKWLVDYADHQCVASRTFGTPDDSWHLVVKPSPTSEVVQLILVRNGGSGNAVQEKASLVIGKSPPIKVNQLRYAVQGKGFRLINLTAEQASALADAESIEWGGDGPDRSFSTGPLKQLMQTLAHCRADLRDYWNIVPEKAAQLGTGPMPHRPLIRYFSSNDYPSQAVWNYESELTSIVALIDEKGVVRDCMIDATSGIATLDAMTCIVVREQAKFRPAVSKDGKPARSYFMQLVRWEMP